MTSHAPSTPASGWREDLAAGLVVFLVALPLCLGIALASGAPLASGLVTGAVGGLLVSRLSGSPLMVSGPAAGLTAIVLASLAQLGSFQAFLTCVVLAGAMQIGLGLLRAGVVAHFVPSSVIRGMLAGIGLILIAKQLPYALSADPAASAGPWIERLASFDPRVLGLAGLSLAMLVGWPTCVPARIRKVMPAPLAVVLLGGGLAWWLGRQGGDAALPASAMVALPVAATPADWLGYFSLPDGSVLGEPRIWQVAVTVAIVASLESLLSLEATDRMDPLKRISSPDRELLAQGVGNVACGLIGGLPMTGVIVRSAANVDAGARSWRSSFFHGVLLVGAVATVPGLLNGIPLACLAAVLIHTGFKLAHPAQLHQAWQRGARDWLPFLVTIAVILAADLLMGIAAGIAASLVFVVIDNARHGCALERVSGEAREEIRVVLSEQVSFLSKARLSSAVRRVPRGAVVTVDASRSRQLDHDVIELLHELVHRARQRGVQLHLQGVPMPPGAAPSH